MEGILSIKKIIAMNNKDIFYNNYIQIVNILIRKIYNNLNQNEFIFIWYLNYLFKLFIKII